MWYDASIEKILISDAQIQAKVAEMGARITADYAGEDLLLVGVLKGALMFMVDLARAIDLPVELDFMAISSYGAATETSGVVRIMKDLETSIAGRHVLIVEDIIDSGLTLNYIVDHLRNRGPASIKICSLLSKPARRRVDVAIDYYGFDIPDEFVVGYGLDYRQQYRNVPYVGVLKPETYRPPVAAS
ncbi:MAG TPA: hypoxanthine phosphoribosyltransferase [Chloroflexia bacterium]|nr:hypoxanthine phosphoribosyltransferase [Chloroflexia bacterium]